VVCFGGVVICVKRLPLVIAVALGAWPLVIAPVFAGAKRAAPRHEMVAAGSDLRVRGASIVDGLGGGTPVKLVGVSRSGTEYTCIDGYGFFDSPHPNRMDTPAMIAAIRSWDVNIVRVPLNEDCWLGINGPRRYVGAVYRRVIKRYVAVLRRAGLYVILDLHVSAPGRLKSRSIDWMADADHAPAFWRSVAKTFRSDHGLIFDLYNEPNHIGWRCWRDGCRIRPHRDDNGHAVPAFRAAGMQALVDAVRSTGASQPLMLGGVNWSLDLSQWKAYAPRDPLHQLIASEHNYGGLAPCRAGCRTAILRTHRRYPVLVGELGETDCAHGYIDAFMAWADREGLGYLGWAWDATAPGSWTCRGGPSLITKYDGSPTPYGVGFRDHLRALAGRS
jgi:endoglucanase